MKRTQRSAASMSMGGADSRTQPDVARAAKRATPSEPDPTVGVRVLCVDDHAVLIEGLKTHFGVDGGVCVVGSLSSAAHLLQEADRLRPDVVLLDIEMPGPDVFEAADRLRTSRPEAKCVFLSAHIRDGYLAAAYKCGAWGYFSKADDLEAIVDGVKEVAASEGGAFVMGPKVRQRLASTKLGAARPRAADASAPRSALESLTAREIEVLRLIGKGLSRSEIAATLFRSAKTIDGHQERMMRKLGVSTRTDLLRYAIREGLAEA
ncbi:MAG: DNA-binding response regulator [Phycisphaerales bacterium]|nr:MAG: DNA-binding response regulator [Phycisphaerales bacterium]